VTKGNCTKPVVKQIGLELAAWIRQRRSVNQIEKELIPRIRKIDGWSLIVSGCNRSGLKGENFIIRKPKGGRYVIVLNPLDGHVNYLRSAKIYAASITLSDLNNGYHYALVYDNLYNRVYEMDGRSNSLSFEQTRHNENKYVFAIGRFVCLKPKEALMLKACSLRSLGSTTVSILEVIRGNIDIFVNRTKLWNIFWAFGAHKSGRLYIEDLDTGKTIDYMKEIFIEEPQRSFNILVCRNAEIGNAFHRCLYYMPSELTFA